MTANTSSDIVLTDRAEVPEGWYVQLVRQYAPASLAVGPYPSQEVAESAMEDSLLLDAYCHEDCLDLVVVDVAGLDPVVELAIVDPDEPLHHGPVR